MIWLIAAGLILVSLGLVALVGAPYVPSQRRYVRQAFTELYKLTAADLVVDIGAGDGRVLRIAREFDARAIGFEIQPLLWLIGKYLNRGDAAIQLIWANFWTHPLPDGVTLVYAFSVKRDNQRLTDKLRVEANRLNREIHLMCLGSPLTDIEPQASLGAYWLYRFVPSQSNSVKL
ncbi:hypothetical protein B7Y94_03315 [Candidatus Saccharibacteria bacterium 32-49-12]|nr:MAG: hypothetical protein B7Y94_03315 [Candidatus Saccharibacteria bacterium 32-49-12]